MTVNKLHREFHTLDEADGSGMRTRRLRFAPGTHTTAPIWHNY